MKYVAYSPSQKLCYSIASNMVMALLRAIQHRGKRTIPNDLVALPCSSAYERAVHLFGFDAYDSTPALLKDGRIGAGLVNE